jgi:hypothetical protein
MAIVTYNDNGTIKVVKFGNYVVSTDADPVAQKEWVFVGDWPGVVEISLELSNGPTFNDTLQGCAPLDVLRDELTLQYDPNGFFIDTRAAVRMSGPAGQNCLTRAVFEVQFKQK